MPHRTDIHGYMTFLPNKDSQKVAASRPTGHEPSPE